MRRPAWLGQQPLHERDIGTQMVGELVGPDIEAGHDAAMGDVPPSTALRAMAASAGS